MKRITLLAAAFLAVSQVFAQATLKKVIELEMPEGDGTNGASVVWHPVQKKYYASFAGNAEYPFAVFDIKGKRLSEDDLVTTFDIRGLWYNPKVKKIQANGYDENGWAEYTVNAKGIPGEAVVIREGMNQPDRQSSGAFNPVTQVIYFLDDEMAVVPYKLSTGEAGDPITLHLGIRKENKDEEDEDVDQTYQYNTTTVIYTGIKGAEIGVLNIMDNQVELYNIANGYLTKTLAFPEESVAPVSLNFAYTNGIYWIFNVELRTWTGYK